MITFGFFLFSISEHSFHVTAIKKLFFVRTADERMFGTLKQNRNKYLDKELIPIDTPREIKEEIFKHRYIDIKNCDWVSLYFARILGCCCPRFCFKKRDMFIKLYDRGKNRIEGELDIVKIIKSIRNMKILMKNSFMNQEVIHQIYHQEKNLINIDESLSSKGETEAEQPE